MPNAIPRPKIPHLDTQKPYNFLCFCGFSIAWPVVGPVEVQQVALCHRPTTHPACSGRGRALVAERQPAPCRLSSCALAANQVGKLRKGRFCACWVSRIPRKPISVQNSMDCLWPRFAASTQWLCLMLELCLMKGNSMQQQASCTIAVPFWLADTLPLPAALRTQQPTVPTAHPLPALQADPPG
jgi:hypothetical protein